jgi:hypothetical protein
MGARVSVSLVDDWGSMLYKADPRRELGLDLRLTCPKTFTFNWETAQVVRKEVRVKLRKC